MAKRLIVPGASGFIGRNLIRAIPADWEVVALYHQSHDFPDWVEKTGLHHIKAVCCDLTDSVAVNSLADRVGKNFDQCVFLAANGDPAYSVDHPLEDLRSNVITLLCFLSQFRIEKLIYFSSGAVYDGLQGPVSPTVAVFPRLPYAISNWACEHYVRAFANRSQVSQYINLRFFGAFGPYEPPRKIYTKLVHRFAFERLPHFTIRGDGCNYIDAMYVKDTIHGILSVLRSDRGNLTLDFCSGKPLTINELVRTAAQAFGFSDVEIKHTGHVPEYINFFVSGDPMAQMFGFRPKISLHEGLQQFAEFLKRQEDINYG